MSDSHISYTPDWYPHQSVTRPPALTLREYYAGLAMQALINNADHSHLSWDGIAQNACGYADALIAELQREGNYE